MGDEAGVPVEPGGGPLPDLSDALEVPLGPGRRLLPLGFCGEPCSVRAGEGVGLEPGDVAHRSVRMPRLCVWTVRDVIVLLPRPALVAPPLAALIAAALGEVQPRRVGDRPAGDAEGADLDAVARALVVVGEDVLRGPERGRAGRDVEPLGRRVAVEGL